MCQWLKGNTTILDSWMNNKTPDPGHHIHISVFDLVKSKIHMKCLHLQSEIERNSRQDLAKPLWNISVTNGHGYVPLVVSTSRSFPHSWHHGFVTILSRRVPLVEQELLTLPEHLSSPPVFSGVRIAWSLVLCVCFVDRCLSFCTFSYGHCVVCSSSVYIFWLPLWYIQALFKCQHDDLQVHTMPCFCFLHSITWKMYFQAR